MPLAVATVGIVPLSRISFISSVCKAKGRARNSRLERAAILAAGYAAKRNGRRWNRAGLTCSPASTRPFFLKSASASHSERVRVVDEAPIARHLTRIIARFTRMRTTRWLFENSVGRNIAPRHRAGGTTRRAPTLSATEAQLSRARVRFPLGNQAWNSCHPPRENSSLREKMEVN